MFFKESIEVHDTLNPKLWDKDNKLKEDVYGAIIDIITQFIDELEENEIPIKVLDAHVVGSNASFNYTSDSDLDIHIIVNLDELSCDAATLNTLYMFFKSYFNDKYEITIKDIPVELYIEDIHTSTNSRGVYSIFKDEWIKFPKKEDIPDVDIDNLLSKYEITYAEVEESEDAELAGNLIDELYLLRKASIEKYGEYGEGNLVFKEFRNLGYLDKLKEIRDKGISKELSLEGLKEKILNKDMSESIDDNANKLAREIVTYYNNTEHSDKLYLSNSIPSNLNEHGAFFILPNGEFFYGFYNHVDVEEILQVLGKSNYTDVEDYIDYNILIYNSTFQDLGSIRGNINKYSTYLELPKKLPARVQFDKIEDILDYIQTHNTSKSVEISIYDTNTHNTYNFSDYTTDDIIKKIKRYYSSGKLYEDILKTSSAYMLNTSGELLDCGLIHPYIKYIIQNQNKKEIESLFNDRLDSLIWFYKNTTNNGLKDDIDVFVNSVINSNNYIISNETKEICRNDFITSNDYIKDIATIEELFLNINNECNQEFCRVRTSHMRLPIGTSGDIYFRISSVGFNWFNLIWKLVYDNKSFINSVSICTDTQSTGKPVKFYTWNGDSINRMPTDEFISLSGNPLIESTPSPLGMLKMGKSLNESLGNISPIHVNRCVKTLMETQFRDNLFELHEKIFTESKEDKQKLIDFVGNDYTEWFFDLKDKNKLKPPYNDIYYWLKKKPQELRDYIIDIDMTPSKSEQRRSEKSGAKLVYNKNGWKIYRIDTYASAKYYGKGTKWCISGNYDGHEEQGESYFNDYNKRGVNDYYFIISPDNHKWCYLDTEDNFIDSVLWDEKDNGIDDIYDDTIPNIPQDALKVLPNIENHLITMGPIVELIKKIKSDNGLLTVTKNVRDLLMNTTTEDINELKKYITKIRVQGDIERIDAGLFSWLNVKKVVVEEGITTIENGAFHSCKYMDFIRLPETLTTIYTGAFVNCISLRKIYIPSSVKYIEDYAFLGCDNLTISCGVSEDYADNRYGSFWNVKKQRGLDSVFNEENLIPVIYTSTRITSTQKIEEELDNSIYYRVEIESPTHTIFGIFNGIEYLNNALEDAHDDNYFELYDLIYDLADVTPLPPDNINLYGTKFAYTELGYDRAKPIIDDIANITSTYNWKVLITKIPKPKNIVYSDEVQIAYID